ncbi:MAG: DUF5058 family protein [Lachnospiraceae bacterium]|nr:DUF5058 family protein [Lachnospiraceae bacterium]
MDILKILNSPAIYLICGSIVLFVAVVCVVFAVRAYRAGCAIGMDTAKMKRAIISSATFAVLPSVGILLGVIALSGSLGTPWPWLRLSVIGALHYETQVAEAAAEAAGISGLSASSMTPQAFTTIALLMSVCIMWGMVFAILTCKRYTKRLTAQSSSEPDAPAADAASDAADPAAAAPKKKSAFAGFGDKAMTAMFIGLVSTYIGSYIGELVSGEGILAFAGSALPLLVALVGAAAMGLFLWIREKKKAAWVDSFSIAGSMLIAMAAAVLFGRIL